MKAYIVCLAWEGGHIATAHLLAPDEATAVAGATLAVRNDAPPAEVALIGVSCIELTAETLRTMLAHVDSGQPGRVLSLVKPEGAA